MRKSIILIVGLVGAVNLQCADRGEDSKSAVPASTSPREQYVQIKSIKDLEIFTKSVVAFRGDDWVDEYGGAVHDHDHVDRRYSLKLDGDHFAYLDGCTFELAPRFSREGAVHCQMLGFKIRHYHYVKLHLKRQEIFWIK